MDVEEGAAAAVAVATAATEATPRAVVPLATPLASSSPATAPPPPLVVPTIPNFSEIIARQEIVRQRQHEQLQQHPHPRSEAAQRKRCALASDDDDDKDDGARSPHSTFQISPGGEYDQTARPGGSRHHPVMSDDGRDSDSEVNTYQTSP
ncbi:hypothetical protein JKF63_07852 [Porcisia hertigi]|uniref:Uncharacterized protein n=1 Tax=Porcisia hertigi TaxID=2761500 RepID=A0A836YI44_9TRYP|nr:hypothetical protein JKF63_07852 [Porcisia hertigi]